MHELQASDTNICTLALKILPFLVVSSIERSEGITGH